MAFIFKKTFVMVFLISAGYFSPTDAQPIHKVDEDTVEVRRPAQNVMDEYVTNPDFFYDRQPDLSLSVIDKLQWWLWEQIFSRIPRTALETTFDVLPYILAAVGLYLLFSKVLTAEMRGLFYKNPVTTIQKSLENPESIHTADFEGQIAQAIAQRQFRQAIRLWYLKTLKALDSLKLIDWEMNKTNRQYVTEFKKPDLMASFADLTRMFEYIWYGDMLIDEQLYAVAAQSFRKFNSALAPLV